MLRFLKHALIFSTCVLTGCSTIYGSHGVIQNRGTDYLNANSIPPLKIPPGMSSSDIEAHYPVSDRYYPTQDKTVKLTPPNLSKTKLMQPKAMPPEVPVISQGKIKQQHVSSGFTVHNTASHNPATQGFIAATPDPQTLSPAQKKQAESHYYDPHTRSSTGGVGKPIASALKEILPSGKKPSAQNGSQANSQRNNPNLFGQPSAGAAMIAHSNLPLSQTGDNTSQKSTQKNGIGKTLSNIAKSIWPWGKSTKKQEAIKKEEHLATNDPSHSTDQQSKMPSMYFDRYTRR